MAAQFALSWNRPPDWAELLRKHPGRAVSFYRSHRYDDVEHAAAHINSLDPTMECKVEVFT